MALLSIAARPTWAQAGIVRCAAVLLGACLAANVVADPLVGIWGGERNFNVSPANSSVFRVVVEEQEEGLFAAAGGIRVAARQLAPVGAQATARSAAGDWFFLWPGNRGALRLAPLTGGAEPRTTPPLTGHWLFPRSAVTGNEFAVPLQFERTSDSVWVATVEALPVRHSVFLQIESTRGGRRGLLRNPERNDGVRLSLASITQSGEQVLFRDRDGAVVLQGQLRNVAGAEPVLSVQLPARGGSFDLTRRVRAEARGFFPRPTTSAYRYTRPAPLADGWPVASPAEVGLDVRQLTALVRSIAESVPAARSSPAIHSVLIARHGRLVLEEYFYGWGPSDVHDLRSASKSMTGLMVGQALAETDPTVSEAQPVYALFGLDHSGLDPRARRMRVADLLTMRSGWDCDDNDEASRGNENTMQAQIRQPDWRAFALALPMRHEPGQHAAYCSAGINVLGKVVEELSGTWLPAFFRSRFAAPMSIDRYYVNLDPRRQGYAGGGLRLRPRDFLKFGQLVLNRGRWLDRQLVPADWIDRSLAPHASVNERDDYGYTWWRGEYQWRDRRLPVFSATGNGGQLLVIVPGLSLVVSFTGGNYGNFPTWVAWRNTLVPGSVLPAVIDGRPE